MSRVSKPKSKTATGNFLYRPFSNEELLEGIKQGDYQTWALCGLDHPMDPNGQPMERIFQRGGNTIKAPFLRILHTPPKKYGSAPWKWVPVEPSHFIWLMGRHGLVMRKRINGKVVRLMNDPRLMSVRR